MLKLKIIALILLFMGHGQSFAGTIFSSTKNNSDVTENEQNRWREEWRKERLRRDVAQEVFEKIKDIADPLKNPENFVKPANEMYQWIEQQPCGKENITELDFRRSYYAHYASCVEIIKNVFYDNLRAEASVTVNGIVENKELQQDVEKEIFDVLQTADSEKVFARLENIRFFYKFAQQCSDQKALQNDFVWTVCKCVQHMGLSGDLYKYFPEM